MEETRFMPEQSTMDNLDSKGNHMTVEYRETERQDTSHLSSEPVEREEILNMFSLELVMMTAEKHSEELEHLNKVILHTTGRALAAAFPGQIGHWENVLPLHHCHPLSHVKPQEAAVRLMPPHYRQVICAAESFKLMSAGDQDQ